MMDDALYSVSHDIEGDNLTLEYAPEPAQEGEDVTIRFKDRGTSGWICMTWDEWSTLIKRFDNLVNLADADVEAEDA